ncbi:hypothetical protein ABVK25_008521 [Lepraria finkii]|uniref:Uncharacterized protein n=1 Tax=Lepraria finkii TaxID=1340010 RepID=A0ABR4B227_9LECA
MQDGLSEYKRCYRTWAVSQSYRGKHQMINKKSAPSNWDDLVKDTRKIYEETDQDAIAKFEKCLPADLAYLFQALVRCRSYIPSRSLIDDG